MANYADSYYQTSAIESLRGVGKRYAEILKIQGFNTLFDLCFDLPFRYLDKTKITPCAKVLADDNFYLVKGKITSQHTFKGKVLKISLVDETGRLDAIFFNALSYFTQNFKINQEVVLFGQGKPDFSGVVCLQHPQVTFINDEFTDVISKTLTPVYHLSENLAQQNLRKIMELLMQKLKALPLEEILPQKFNPYSINITEAILNIHAPLPPKDNSPFNLDLSPYFKRICYEELLAYQLSLLKLKELNSHHKALPLAIDPVLETNLLEHLPFTPTNGQMQAYKDICQDLQKDIPMLRLLQGDVGSGKTLVAIMSCLQVCRNGKQCALLAPTELLATQHYHNFQKILNSFAVNIVLLHSSLPKAKRSATLEDIKNGNAHIIIGTHSIFQDEVKYHNLALAVIDEQHRFGLEQKTALLRKAPEGISLHQLVMTATPIPRTLQLALYSNLDVSSIYDKPPGRKKIITVMASDKRRSEVILRLKNITDKGLQAYWVCPLIGEEESDNSSAQNVFKEIKRLLPDVKSDILHGELNASKKQQVMEDFVKGSIQILVATTIVEVGVDVPNAAVIVIDGAQRLGMAQLHQLRGRVGRGDEQGSCVLLYTPPEDPIALENVLKRLEVIKNNDDGFKIAAFDLKMRGPGEIMGTAQSGFDFMKIADIGRDQDLLNLAHKKALQLKNEEPECAEKLINRWFPKLISGS